MIMIVSTSAAGRIPACDGSPEKIGRKPATSCSHGSRWSRTHGPSTRMPQSPRRRSGSPPAARPWSRSAPRPAGRDLGEEERDRDRERHRERQRDQRRDDRPVDERERAVLVGDGIPGVRPDEAELELLDRGPGEVEDLVRDQAEDGRGRRRGDRDSLEGDVAEAKAAAPEVGSGAAGRTTSSSSSPSRARRTSRPGSS